MCDDSEKRSHLATPAMISSSADLSDTDTWKMTHTGALTTLTQPLLKRKGRENSHILFSAETFLTGHENESEFHRLLNQKDE